MEYLWSPWRSEFIDSADATDSRESPFELAFAAPEHDRENYLLHRGLLAFIILNKYPYNAGHLLIVPVRATGDFLELTDEERLEIMNLIRLGIAVLTEALQPHGFNVGMNLGRTAGAAIDTHVHFHIVPRWNGDTNFMSVLDNTRVISESMNDVFEKLVSAKNKILG